MGIIDLNDAKLLLSGKTQLGKKVQFLAEKNLINPLWIWHSVINYQKEKVFKRNEWSKKINNANEVRRLITITYFEVNLNLITEKRLKLSDYRWKPFFITCPENFYLTNIKDVWFIKMRCEYIKFGINKAECSLNHESLFT